MSSQKKVSFSLLVMISVFLIGASQNANSQLLNLTGQQNITTNDINQSLDLVQQQNITTYDKVRTLDLTQHKNFTQPLGMPFFRCFLSTDQPSDPIEMETSLVPTSAKNPIPLYITEHRVYEVFECKSDIVAFPPWYKRDIVLSTRVVQDNLGRITQTGAGAWDCNITDEGNKGNVINCGARTVPDTSNRTLTGCTELSVEHPIAFNKREAAANNSLNEGNIFAQTHEYNCSVPSAEKLKVVTIFNAGRSIVSVTCIVDIPNATTNRCEAKEVKWSNDM